MGDDMGRGTLGAVVNKKKDWGAIKVQLTLH
jgi:hypothetical protein